jgi:REP element-mobilizing transposase RayT
MARPLRIEYPRAFYHLINRGQSRRDIFLEDKGRQTFLDLLAEITGLWKIEIHAYCLMSNHYHLLVSTPAAGLSRAMRHLDGIYTQKFNRVHKRDGSLFRGRYKAILIDAQRSSDCRIGLRLSAISAKAWNTFVRDSGKDAGLNIK